MTTRHVAGNDYSAHFEHIITDSRHESNPLMTEYRLLYDEFNRIKSRFNLLEKEKHNLETLLGEMNRSLELATRIDPMTGLSNRRDISEKIEREYSRAQRHQRTFSILLADLDNFKLINDTHGYNVGDDVLVEVARVMMGCVRHEDVCARWGGEQFLFLLTETPIAGALTLARKVHESISMTTFCAQRSGISLTTSIGVCEYQQGQSINDCISRVDAALQQAQREGKNRFCVAP